MVDLIFLTALLFADGAMDSVIASETRREYILVGSSTASMLCTVSESMPESIFIALGECDGCFIWLREIYTACSTRPFFPSHFFQTVFGILTVRDKPVLFVVDEPVFAPVMANRY